MNNITYSEALEDLLMASNVAGYLEAQGQIFVDSDMELTEFVIRIYNDWPGDNASGQNFIEYAVDELRREFGNKEANV